MSEKVSRMEQAIDWRDEIGTIAGPFDGNRKSWLAAAARRAAVPFRQVKALYYGETTNPRHDTAESIKEAAREARLREAKRDAAELADIYRRHAQALAVADPDFHRPEIDALVAAARILGRADRT